MLAPETCTINEVVNTDVKLWEMGNGNKTVGL